jgi:hypothetical protein
MDTGGIIQQLCDRFPDFELKEDDKDLPTVAFAFFSSYVKRAIGSGNEVLVQSIIAYLGGLVDSGNAVLESCLDEIALGLDEKRGVFLQQTKSVNQKLYERLRKTIQLWAGR